MTEKMTTHDLIACLTKTNQFHEDADITTDDVVKELYGLDALCITLEAQISYITADRDAWISTAKANAEEMWRVTAERDKLASQINDAQQAIYKTKIEARTLIDDAESERDKLKAQMYSMNKHISSIL